MYTFSQLVLRNIILAILFSLSMTIISVIFLSFHFTEAASSKQRAVESIVSYALLDDKKINEKQLRTYLESNQQFKRLSISTKATGSEKTIFNYTNKNSFSLPFVSPPPNEFTLVNSPLYIMYEIDTSAASLLTIKLLLSMFVLALGLVFYAATMSIKRHGKVFNLINNKIKHDLSLINHSSEKDNSTDTLSEDDNDILEIPELKAGVEEIKRLISQQQQSSIILEKDAYLDRLTMLDNRARFVQFYEDQIVQDSPVKFGVLIITRCSELQTINQIHGYNEGDNYISRVAEIIKITLSTQPSAKLFRLNSSDFACILPNVQLKEAEDVAKELTAKFNDYQQASDLDSVGYTGLVYFDKSKPLGELLALADTGISVAQTQHMNAWYSQKDTEILKSSAHYGNQNWRQEIDSVIENQRISLLLQPIQPSGRNSKVYSEVLARFLNSNDEMLPTASFIAMAEKLDKIVAIDKLIIDTAITEITNKNMVDHSFGINISARSITDEHFLIWLERKLLREPTVAPRLIFELTEYGLQQNIKTSKRLIDMLHRVGARVTVERFGVGLTSFKFFRDLKPDFIKMDSTYTRDIDDDKNNQYFLRLMVDLAHRLGISVLAESVESQEEKHTLEKLFIDGCQGFYIGKPSPF